MSSLLSRAHEHAAAHLAACATRPVGVTATHDELLTELRVPLAVPGDDPASVIDALAAAVLAANNHRDAAHDARVGRRTFAVVFGPRAAAALHRGLVAVAFALLPVVAWTAGSPGPLLPLLLAPGAVRLVRELRTAPRDASMTPLVLRTVRLALRHALLMATGTVIARLAAA